MKSARVLIIIAVVFGVLAAASIPVMMTAPMSVEVFFVLAITISINSLVVLGCLYFRSRSIYSGLMSFGVVMAVATVLFTALVMANEFFRFPLLRAVLPRGVTEIGLIIGWMSALVPLHWGLLGLIRLERPVSRRLRDAARWSAVVLIVTSVVMQLRWMTPGQWHWLAIPLVIGLVASVGLATSWQPRHPAAAALRMGFATILGACIVTVTFILITDWPLDARGSQAAFGGGFVLFSMMHICVMLLALILTAIVPLAGFLEFLTRRESHAALTKDVEVSITCPRCETAQTIRTGEDLCEVCGLRFALSIEEPRCECGYVIHRVSGDCCPECGRELAFKHKPAT